MQMSTVEPPTITTKVLSMIANEGGYESGDIDDFNRFFSINSILSRLPDESLTTPTGTDKKEYNWGPIYKSLKMRGETESDYIYIRPLFVKVWKTHFVHFLKSNEIALDNEDEASVVQLFTRGELCMSLKEHQLSISKRSKQSNTTPEYVLNSDERQLAVVALNLLRSPDNEDAEGSINYVPSPPQKRVPSNTSDESPLFKDNAEEVTVLSDDLDQVGTQLGHNISRPYKQVALTDSMASNYGLISNTTQVETSRSELLTDMALTNTIFTCNCARDFHLSTHDTDFISSLEFATQDPETLLAQSTSGTNQPAKTPDAK